jgi:hypothetical protein
VQRIVVFQQQGSGEEKIRAVREHGQDLEIAAVVDIDDPLPAVLDEPEAILPDPDTLAALAPDLVLDHLRHPDLTHALALLCREAGLPVIASGRRVPVEGLIAPPTCCGLAEAACPGPYGAQFGLPAYEVTLDDAGHLAEVHVTRGAPCGATWDATPSLRGLSPAEAVQKVGLASQLHCKADPSNWDPIHGKSPVHFAGRVHARALRRALERLGVTVPTEPES